MKLAARTFLITVISVVICSLAGCKQQNNLQLVEWTKVEMFQLPQPVIDFYYNAEENPSKIFTVLDSTYSADQLFTKTSSLTETHYTVQINHQRLQLRERDFRAPFLIFDGKLYYSKSHILKGKLMTPQDLFIYSVDLKTVLK